MKKLSAYEYVHAMSKAASFALRVKRAGKVEKKETPALVYLAGPSAPLGTDSAEFYQELIEAEKERRRPDIAATYDTAHDCINPDPDDDRDPYDGYLSLYRYRYNDYNPYDPKGKQKDRKWWEKKPNILELLPIRLSR